MCTIILTNDESYRYMMFQIDQMLLQMYCASLKNYACHEKVAYYKKIFSGKRCYIPYSIHWQTVVECDRLDISLAILRLLKNHCETFMKYKCNFLDIYLY